MIPMFESLAFLVIFGCAAVSDLKNLSVPELLSALLWLIVIFPPFSIATAGIGFAGFFAFTALYEFLYKEPFWGWADTLAMGPFFAGLAAFAVPSLPLALMLLCATVVGGVILTRKRKKKAGVPLVFLEFVVLLFTYLASPF